MSAATHAGHQHKHHDHSQHHEMMIQDFKKRFFISLVLTLPILFLSPLVQDIFDYDITFTGAKYLLFILSSLVYFYGGWPFLEGFYKEVTSKNPGMMTLIAVAITVAFAYSGATTFGLEGKSFFWELATLVDVMLLGHWIEMRSVLRASDALQKLVALMPATAHKIASNGDITDVDIAKLAQGDRILIRPGEKIPADAQITSGQSYVDESMVTGEARPVKKTEPAQLIGGTVNKNGSIEAKVQQVGKDSYLHKVIDMVRDAQNKKSKTQELADRIAFYLTLIALGVGFATLVFWSFTDKPFVFAIERMATVMVITCPHALGLAVPLVVAISTSMAAGRGLLIRNRSAFENTRNLTTLFFDKTGTLTKGNFAVDHFESVDKRYKSEDILSIAASMESRSEHPMAAAITQKAKQLELHSSDISDFEVISGAGIAATLDDRSYKIVGQGYLKSNDITAPKLENRADQSIVFMVEQGSVIGYITLADEIRPESFAAIKALKKTGLKIYMMTGDGEQSAGAVSKQLGLDGYFARLLPDEKLAKIEAFQQRGEVVAMTGDGINDAPALAAADVGIAVGSGTDIAAETADIILVDSNPHSIVSLLAFGKATHAKMIQNFIWATGYNVAAIPLAAGVLYNAGIVINPALGAVLMSASTVIVAINAQLLRRHW
ncbi:MAG: copper-translocating P-type ATPase, partial [Campylobacterota bacterium]